MVLAFQASILANLVDIGSGLGLRNQKPRNSPTPHLRYELGPGQNWVKLIFGLPYLQVSIPLSFSSLLFIHGFYCTEASTAMAA